ncbi:MAG: protein translocase subunit SecF [Pegethrix bostrychoides GSE-TBD4-15B]|jgi:preprotein translocase subunit SecF|uniref:Protein-export membrane protein SecF n=1 Tax=Pegethrix bostrychoides GSE-TBD4-15B TaxID=2839662 RepID=A0A951U4C5_9CYAN|nr:protein translocase subunit SecF [Pegethrix bostrychoides GSE-TBD4-15B]
MKLQIIRQRSVWWAISALMILSGILAMGLLWNETGLPLRPSIDFVGGTRLQLELDCTQPQNCDQPIDAAAVRTVLSQQNLGNSSIQVVGSDQHALAIRSSTLNVEQRSQLVAALNQEIGSFAPDNTQIDTVGPTVGRQLFKSGILALLVSFAGIMAYLSLRFQFDFAVFAILALVHDVLVTTGIFAILGKLLGVEVDSLFIVSLLTIIGFSVNDTVVIYDRIRETIQLDGNRSINDIVDDAVNQTLGRSINTTMTTLLPLVAIFFLGGETLKYFALALIIGFVAGAYSSIFIASTLLAWWRVRIGQEIPGSSVGAETTDSEGSEYG